ncbi:hypothetical protein SAMN05192529_12740 [Arachidicoccus rhizosphaerae]|uniref:Glycosyl hydrolase family 95 catalytic domain-containing protein n=1 Tax=Arachidicoccus rhizosphaerae TaxID=551991 RepID=A0A1H4C4W4_9BACT|nr:hypothetical protein [Arachidicoccus rhizosphaerae]SEA55421.1 hypothetical protein SAMN05192529_12740 [Arachidicoccus rhizosphaerae]
MENFSLVSVRLQLRQFSVAALFSLMGTVMTTGNAARAQQTQNQVDWQSFMQRNDMVYDTLTTTWTDGLFTGNGLLGNTIFIRDASTLRIDVGRTDVRDHRKDTVLGDLFSRARLPIGYFSLQPLGHILSNTARLDIWNAVAKGILQTDKGSIYWRSWTESNKNVIIFQVGLSAGEKDAGWNFHPAEAKSPRIDFHPELKDSYTANPAAREGREGLFSYVKQSLLAGGGYTTLWQMVAPAEATLANAFWMQDPFYEYYGHSKAAGQLPVTWRTYYISIGNDSKDLTASLKEAKLAVHKAAAGTIPSLLKDHESWWHAYYQKSFISLPDPVVNSFYWAQLYKLASASRINKPLIDLMGPWMAATPWPANWWNLNTELTYSPLYTSNHLDIASVLGHAIYANRVNLYGNVPAAFQYNSAGLGRASGPEMKAPLMVTGAAADKNKPDGNMELGDLTWNLYYYWLQYRYSMDTTVLERLYPILKRNINYYLHLAKKEADGYYHLPYTYSPEYPGGMTRDANYALSLFRWGCQTLIEASHILGKKDSLVPRWQQMLEELTPYPTNENGLMIGRDVPFAKSHRHYSHLLMIYPLHLITWQDSAYKPLIQKSLAHWHSLPGALQGYSFTGGASIYALMGKGDQALDYLKTFIHKYVKANTMYTESGPVIETPLAAATSIQELLIQSYNGIIRVFPAAPTAWADISFDHLRTEGAFLVSAVRKGGRTLWVKVQATADGPCILQPGFDAKQPLLIKTLSGSLSSRDVKPWLSGKVSDEKNYQLYMHKGDEVVLYTDQADLQVPLSAVGFDPSEPRNYFGKKLKK